VKEKPILFNGNMVRAILAGNKTQTRRIAKPVKHPDLGNLYDPGALALEPQHVIERAGPYGKPGDRLWVRETCRAEELPSGLDGVRYLADDHFVPLPPTPSPEAAFKWMHLNAYGSKRGASVPSIHMPRWASRLLLEITDVRVERLQGVTFADARAEGWQSKVNGRPNDYDPISWYELLWAEINGEGSWDANPWVWCITFRRVEA